MKKRRRRRRGEREARPIRNRAALVAVCLIVTLAAGGAILAAGGTRWLAVENAPNPQIDPLAPGNPSKEYIYVGGRLLATEEPPGSSGCGSPPGAPGALVATADFSQQLKVHLTWPASANADHYEVQRRQNGDAFSTLLPDPASNVFDDFTVAANTAYIYRVRAMDAQEICPSAYSNIDLATTTNFAENVVTGTPIKAAHLLELATAVGAVRITAGFPSGFTWGSTPAPAPGGSILKAQMQKLRDDLNQARSSLGLSPQPFSNDPLVQGVTPVLAIHIQELRNGVK